jgi:uncharacterized protein (TIGR02246 family)
LEQKGGVYNSGMRNLAEDVAQRFSLAINGQDPDKLAELMTPAHRFIDALGQAVEGREAMRAAWTGYFRMVPDYTITVEESFCLGQVVVMLGTAQGTYAPDGQLRAENRWQTPAAFRARIEDGKVAEWRVIADNEPMRQLMAAYSKSQSHAVAPVS